ncbi:UNVERIFIED_CONTAM: hypothetical protein O8I53_11175 [Campylobacter lari]
MSNLIFSVNSGLMYVINAKIVIPVVNVQINVPIPILNPFDLVLSKIKKLVIVKDIKMINGKLPKILIYKSVLPLFTSFAINSYEPAPFIIRKSKTNRKPPK